MKTNVADKELLELAEKAIGLGGCTIKVGRKNWNPLTDDGDALRLAVKLEIDVYQADDGGYAAYAGYFGKSSGGAIKRLYVIEYPDDPDNFGDACKATRRAITCAAAEIGKESHEEASN